MSQFNPIDKIVGTNVRKERVRQGISQTDLGSALGISFQQVQKYERGLNRISASRLVEIARVLKVEITTLFDGVAGELPSAKQLSLADTRRGHKLTNDMVQLPDDVRKAIANLVSAVVLNFSTTININTSPR